MSGSRAPATQLHKVVQQRGLDLVLRAVVDWKVVEGEETSPRKEQARLVDSAEAGAEEGHTWWWPREQPGSAKQRHEAQMQCWLKSTLPSLKVPSAGRRPGF